MGPEVPHEGMKKMVSNLSVVSGGVLRLVMVRLDGKLTPAATEAPEYPEVADNAEPALAVVGRAKGMTETRAVARRARDQGDRNMPVHCRASLALLHRRHVSYGR